MALLKSCDRRSFFTIRKFRLKIASNSKKLLNIELTFFRTAANSPEAKPFYEIFVNVYTQCHLLAVSLMGKNTQMSLNFPDLTNLFAKIGNEWPPIGILAFNPFGVP